MTKEEARYGEVHFCSFCKHFIFRYGDYHCLTLDAPVAESGYCDLYEKDGKPTPEKATVSVKSCATCEYNMGGMCAKDGSLAKKACYLHHEPAPTVTIDDVVKIVEDRIDEVTIIDPDTFQVVEGSTIEECTTCADSYYDSNGVAMCRRYNAALDMSDLTACVEYNEDQEVSNETVEDSNR
jgi:hypothetical protein